MREYDGLGNLRYLKLISYHCHKVINGKAHLLIQTNSQE